MLYGHLRIAGLRDWMGHHEQNGVQGDRFRMTIKRLYQRWFAERHAPNVHTLRVELGGKSRETHITMGGDCIDHTSVFKTKDNTFYFIWEISGQGGSHSENRERQIIHGQFIKKSGTQMCREFRVIPWE